MAENSSLRVLLWFVMGLRSSDTKSNTNYIEEIQKKITIKGFLWYFSLFLEVQVKVVGWSCTGLIVVTPGFITFAKRDLSLG